MKKIFVYLTLALFGASCGDDDSGSSGKVPVQITMTSEDDNFDNVYQFQYESGNRLKGIMRTGAQTLNYVFQYGDKKMPQSVSVTGDIEATVQFAYDNRGRIISIDNAGMITTITYTTDDSFMIGPLTGTLQPNGDLKSLLSYQFSYDTEKGPFAHVKGVSPLMLSVLENNMPYYVSKKALTSFVNGDNPALSTTATHTYENGLPVLTQVQGGSTFTMAFTYQ